MTLIISLLSSYLLFISFPNESTVLLDDALQTGMISLEATANGGHLGQSLALDIRNRHPADWYLKIPAGFQFTSADTTQQDLIVIKEQTIAMNNRSSVALPVLAMCTQAHKSSPTQGSLFRPAGSVTGKLSKLVKFIDQSKMTDDAAQYAIWALTDQLSVANIEDDLLKELTAALLGVKVPTYTVVNTPTPNQAGRPAFSNQPALLKGTFTCRLEGEVEASFGLFNAEGKELFNLFADEMLKKGNHTLRFSFEISDLPRGSYFARLHSNGHLIQEEEMRW